MKKLNRIIVVALVVAAVGIIVFWAAGFNGNIKLAGQVIVMAGVSAWIAIVSMALRFFRCKNLY